MCAKIDNGKIDNYHEDAMRMLIAVFVISLGLSAAVSAETISVQLSAVLCDSCTREIEKAFVRQAEVQKVDVDLAQKRVNIQTRRGETMSDLKVIQLLRNAGYVAGKIVRSR